ncbi:fibronectin type III domain-containing protein, partial [candidate division WWE3 bacterium]|nr:fibronectin type III domain-containing protein [candidate division WWE3 bacterium]
PSESTYTVPLSGLADGTTYHYQLKLSDADGNEYSFEDHEFATIARPLITNVRIQQVTGTAQPSVFISWESNTEISSIINYFPQSTPNAAINQVDVTPIAGEHQMLVSGLQAQTQYALTVRGVDRYGNEAASDLQIFTTATDTRPPAISNLQVDTSIVTPEGSDQSTAQIAVSWDTDEPTTSQVEFGEGTGTTYARSTQEDTNLTFNHLVIISDLAPSNVYHLRALSNDSAGNTGTSADTVTITPKATSSALDLVIGNLQQIFGFLLQ